MVDAIRLARTTGLEVSVRGGGHNVAGRAVIDGALMIDLSLILSALEDTLRFGISKPDERPEDAAGGTKTSSAGGSG